MVLALSYGEQGESGELWKEPNQTLENVKHIRHEEAAAAASAVGATFRRLDLGDYPLNITDAAMEQLVELFRDMQPHIVLTHTPVDPLQSRSSCRQPNRAKGTPAGVRRWSCQRVSKPAVVWQHG